MEDGGGLTDLALSARGTPFDSYQAYGHLVIAGDDADWQQASRINI
jgi:hypothetical protein